MAFELVDGSEFATRTKGYLKWQWRKLHGGTHNTPNNNHAPEESEPSMTFRQEILAEKDETKAMNAIDASPYAPSTKKTIKAMWRKEHGKSNPKSKTKSTGKKSKPIAVAGVHVVAPPIHAPNAMTMELALAWRDSLLQQLQVIDALIQMHTQSVVVEPSEDPCMVCGGSPEGYDLRCGHAICHKCFQQAGFQMTCKVCGHVEKCDVDHDDFPPLESMDEDASTPME